MKITLFAAIAALGCDGWRGTDGARRSAEPARMDTLQGLPDTRRAISG